MLTTVSKRGDAGSGRTETMFSLSSALRTIFGLNTATPAAKEEPMPPQPMLPPQPAPARPPIPTSGGPLLPRGVRNNNPGNIDRDGTIWRGMAVDQSGDDRFCVFVSAEYGIRALIVILQSYQSADRCATIRQMINRWAPRTENNTTAYVDFVAGRVGIGADTAFDIHDWTFCAAMTEAIIAQENADYAYPAATVNGGLSLAGVNKAAKEA